MIRRAFATLAVAAALAAAPPPPLAAQGFDAEAAEAALRRHFEGRSVTLLLDMPATEKGVDVRPRADRPLDYPAYAARLKEHGTSIRRGESSTVTKVKLKGKHIEFQLGGGGYGTFGDESGDLAAPTTPKTKREEELDRRIGRLRDGPEKRRLERERDQLRKDREAEDARLAASAADARERRREQVRDKALAAGSRFNIRYDDRLTADAVTPAGVEAALAKYVEFGEQRRPEARDDREELDEKPARRGTAALRKGLLESEVKALLGDPVRSSERAEGRLRVVTREYEPKGEEARVEAQFVEGVLIRFTVSSR